MPYLLFNQDGKKNYIELEQTLMLTMGCTPDCNIILPAGTLSHFRIFSKENHSWFLENLCLEPDDERRITPLADGDQISLEKISIAFLHKIEGMNAAPFNGTITLCCGQKIGDYTISNLLHKSAGTCLYLAEDPAGKPCAVKVFMKMLSDDESETFLKHLKSLCLLKISGMAPYRGCGIIHRNAYYITDYFEHPDLAFRISGKAPMRQKEALGILRNIAEILRNAYQTTETFHGSLNPSNILYDTDDRMMIGEYGLFLWKSMVLNEGRAFASPWYISPEAISGGELSFRTDMYSLGVILFQMLTGVLPFHSRDEGELLGMHLYGTFPLPDERNPNIAISSGTLQMLLKMTARNPADRFDSWDELLTFIAYAENTQIIEKRSSGNFLENGNES